MAVGVFPALKLGVLFLKQISKPLAKMLVSQAKNHPVFRTYFIIPPAQCKYDETLHYENSIKFFIFVIAL